MTNKKLENFVVLGRAAPDEISDGRHTVCVGGWSLDEEEFIRIYPTKIDSNLNRWNIVEIPVTKSNSDSRKESWKIQGSKKEWTNLSEKIKYKRKLKSDEWKELIKTLPYANCIQDLNEEKKSLAFIKPKKIIKTYFERREKHSETIQTKLDNFFGQHKKQFLVKTKQNFPIIPKVDWSCPGPCKQAKGYHTSQILEWGVYEWIRKNSETEWEKVWDNLRIHDDKWEIIFFVGNQYRHRRSFMIISVIRYKGQTEDDEKDEKNTNLDDFFDD